MGRPSPVRLGTVAMLASTSSMTDSRTATSGGPQQPAEKPASIDTDGWDQCPAGLQLYPRGVGLYKPPGHPCKGLAS